MLPALNSWVRCGRRESHLGGIDPPRICSVHATGTTVALDAPWQSTPKPRCQLCDSHSAPQTALPFDLLGGDDNGTAGVDVAEIVVETGTVVIETVESEIVEVAVVEDVAEDVPSDGGEPVH